MRKRCFLVLIAAVMLVVLTACSKVKVKDIEGTWGYELSSMSETISFDSDMTYHRVITFTGILEGLSEDVTGTFTLRDDMITLYVDGQSDPYAMFYVYFQKEKLCLDGGRAVLMYEKQQ